MASKPGILTDWPWKPLGSFKYMILAPWMAHGTYQFIAKGPGERDFSYFLILPFLLERIIHNQIWISLSRHRTAKGNNRILDRGIEFEQVDRESNWDDQILLTGILLYMTNWTIPQASHLPLWKTDGVIITVLIHALVVEYLYYWLHRALHHHFLYSRYHSHHHSSVVTEPISSIVHPFAEHIVYAMLFAIPMYTTVFTRTASIASIIVYTTYIDFMNNMGHCNFELIPSRLFTIFPPLKYLMYTPSFHSLHHTQFRTNYSLFMPIYDYIYGAMDESTNATYETSLQKVEDSPDVVHLTHMTTPESIYHLRLGFASLASRPYSPKQYLWIMWPLTLVSVVWTWINGHFFVLERNAFKKLKLQSWVIPRYNVHYRLPWRTEAINALIEEAILDANQKGVKVLTLGLLNQGEKLNGHGELFIQKHRDLRTKLVDGSSLAVAVVLRSIPKGTSQVLLRGNLNKLACAIAHALCARGIQVNVASKDEHEKRKRSLNGKEGGNLIHSRTFSQKIWLVGDELAEEEQKKAPKGTLFIPFSQFPPKQIRKDCLYHGTPAMIAPKSFNNLDSCENWLPRRVMSAWRVAGIVHALEGWNVNECGSMMFDIEKAWEASLQHGFRPLVLSAM
ncbi:hypothetical protein EUGRSUZ_D01144 [Eucalyptus grandis]|uniref:Uncharacterized protein n=1 Tax=Eucalyptus grandis TaxID=71139 RepID=A0ACC3L5L1_EUCGR|nr:hypothetical protein EUGRSUZ_D01144 [Eucalyptus grandis]